MTELPELSAAETTDARAAVHALARIARLLERRLPASTSPELSMADFRMLAAVAGGEARASRLAQRLAIGKPTVSSSVDSLVRRGLLVRTTHAHDQRVVDLALTAEGARVHAAAEAALAGLVTDLAERTTDRADTLAALARLGAAVESRQAEAAASRLEVRG